MNEDYYFSTDCLTVGYHNQPLINNITFRLKRGQILSLIGPNGSGKSTILKSITKQLQIIRGVVYLNQKDIISMSNKEMAQKMAVVLTERIHPELMTCEEVVASGRYPYTNHFGTLTRSDKRVVEDSLKRVHAYNLKNKDFTKISDGQRQRIMLARAICQEPEIIILDEPTSFLDIKYKIELLDILRDMSQTKKITIIMSLHEIDLASKISDVVMCVKGDYIFKYGSPKEIFTKEIIHDLYDIEHGTYNMQFGSVELKRPNGIPKVFVIGGAGYGIPYYRELQKRNIAFATGILYDNDIDFQVAFALASEVASCPAFFPMSEQVVEYAKELIQRCEYVIDAQTPIGEYNQKNQYLIEYATKLGKKVITQMGEV